jgi:putative DNA primase/helicase
MKDIKQQLPNTWDLVELFISHNPNIKYCMSYKTFYKYNGQFWIIITKDQVTRIIIKFLKFQYPNIYKKFNIKSLDDFILLLKQNEEFSMPDAILKANVNGFLLPFLNGVLNTVTLELLPHSPLNYSTHIIPIEYNSDDSIKNTKFAEFLSSLVNHNSNRLKILRACLKLIFTNNLVYQIALYIYGPGGTGKSTFINLLMYLLGKEVTLSTSMPQLNSRFGLASIIGKYLLVLNDVSLYRGQEPKTIKNIITQDVMEADVKYKQPISFTPNSFLIFTSNVLWDIKNSTTGLSRRMIYFPCDNVPNHKELDLFKIMRNNEVVGSLIPYLGGFINWILSCPQEYVDLLYKGGSNITSMISQDSIYVNPLNVFVKDCLIEDKDHKVRLGSDPSDTTSIYGIYCFWCKNNGLTPSSNKNLNLLLPGLLKQLGWSVRKTRKTVGLVLTGVSIDITYESKSVVLESNPNKVLEDNRYDKDRFYETNNNIVTPDTIINDSEFDNS